MAERDWAAGTWAGSRDTLLRRSLALTPRERLELLEELSDLSEVLLRAGHRARRRQAEDEAGTG
jgi:hypothetical protein